MQALLVIDVVNGIFELPVPLYDAGGFIDRVHSLIERARASSVPIFYFRHLGPPGSPLAAGTRGFEIHDTVAPTHRDTVIDKREPDMFVGTNLAVTLAERMVDELVVCGFSSQDCIDTTVRSGWAKGFKVVLASGAHTTTANAVLSAEQIVKHHELVLKRYARVVAASEIVFAS